MQSQNHFIQLKALFFLLKNIQLTRFFYSVLIALAISILIGVIGYLFYSFLFLAIQIHFNFSFLIWFIPIIGLITVFLYKTFGKEVSAGNKLLFKAYINRKTNVSFVISPLIFLTTCLSHLVGISIGREGTALQIGAGISMLPVQAFDVSKFEKRLLLLLGVATGFSAVFGTPLTATFFAFEYFKVKSTIKYWLWIPVLLFAELANTVSLYLGVHHMETPIIAINWNTTWEQIPYYILLSIVLTLASLMIVQTFRMSSQLLSKIRNEYFRVFIGGISILAIYLIWGLEDYRCLGVHTIVESFTTLQPSYSSVIKLGLTALAIGAGFRGGEVTPLFFIGAMLGNLFTLFVPMDMSIVVVFGLLFIFGRCTQSPIATSFLAFELFGLNTMFLIFPFIFISSKILKRHSIYK